MEESKESNEQEIAKLQQSLQEMQKKIDEKDGFLVTECVAAQKEIKEPASVVKEIKVTAEDTDQIEALTVEVDRLKVSTLYAFLPANIIFTLEVPLFCVFLFGSCTFASSKIMFPSIAHVCLFS